MGNLVGVVKTMEKFEEFHKNTVFEGLYANPFETEEQEKAFKAEAGKIAISMFGFRTVLIAPILVNFAALWISSKPKTRVYEVTAAVSRMVAATDMHDYPFMRPELMKGSFIIESKNHDEPLFGDTFGIGGYWVNDKLFIVGTRFPDGVLMGSTVPVWDGSEISAQNTQDSFMGDISIDEYSSWISEAVRYAIVFSRLMAAERSPIQSERKGSGTKRGRRSESSGWIISRVHLNKKYVAVSTGRTDDEMDKEGKLTTVVKVRGFLRHQAYGPGWKLHKDVWIESFESRRWISPRPTLIKVSA